MNHWKIAIVVILMQTGLVLAQPADTPPTAAPATTSAPSLQPAGVLGAWQSQGDRPILLLVQANRCVLFTDGQLSVLKVLRIEPGKIVAFTMGAEVPLPYEMKADTMVMPIGGKTQTFQRLAAVPKELDIAPIKLGAPAEVPAARLKEIQTELQKRLKNDQALRRKQANREEVLKTDADNGDYIKGVVQEFGWIDVKRFGRDTANAAFILVQHSGSLPLMMAALPEIEKDVKAQQLSAQGYAMLYDRVQLMLGENQRYGTQIGKNAKGQLAVMPLEDKAKVDSFRKDLGLGPLSEYLQAVKKASNLSSDVLMPE